MRKPKPKPVKRRPRPVDLTDPAQFAECWALDNLQPLWAADNIRKGARYAGS